MVESEAAPLSRATIRGLNAGAWVKVTWSDTPPEWAIFLGLERGKYPLPRVAVFKTVRGKRHAEVETVDFDQIVDHAPMTAPTH